MSNASRCRATAAHYAELAEASANNKTRRAYRRLEQLWLDMAPLAESFDRRSDERAKQRIYDIMHTVEQVRQQVA
jgi:hypothetical protein